MPRDNWRLKESTCHMTIGAERSKRTTRQTMILGVNTPRDKWR